MDRCALFVDAGYALADGAMAVHGTRRRDSVSWDHAGLLKFLSGLARDRTGLPVLRCYWYEAPADGIRTAEHDALAETPGLKLRLAKARSGRSEGIDSQLRRDLLALAKSGGISEAVIASANEDLAEIVAEVQDLGLRVAIVHIASDGGWTVPKSLRQECDDIVEISGVHLRPFVELIRGAEPANPDELYAGAAFGSPGLSGTERPMVGAMTHQGLPAAALPAASAGFPAAGGSDYRHGVQQYGGTSFAQPDSQTTYSGGNGSSHPGGQQGQPALLPQNGVAHGGVAQGGQSQHGGPSFAPQRDAYLNGAAQNGIPGGQEAGGSQTDPAQSAAPHATSTHGGMPQSGAPQGGTVQSGFPQSGFPQGGATQASFQSGQVRGDAQGGVVAQPAPQGGYHNAAIPNGMLPGSYPNGTGQNGPAQNSPAQNSLAQLGAPQNGPTQNGPVQNGPVQVGPVQTGLAQNGPEQNSPGQNPYQNGPGQGGVGQGGAGQGTTGQGATGQGAAGQGAAGQNVAQQGGYQHPQNGAPQQGGYPNGMPQNGAQQGSYQNGAPRGGFGGQPQGGYQNGAGRTGARPGDLYGGPYAAGPYAAGPQGAGPQGAGQAGFEAAPTGGQQPTIGQHQPYGPPEPGHFPDQPGAAGADHGARGPFVAPQSGSGPGTAFPPQAPYGAPSQALAQLPAVRAPQAVAVSLPDAVKAAHAEGFGFGESVGRDAPGLWLDAVLARKPRMPSDLEARLLQGSALPIDSLLHDEVRHSLRRGFWDALENARR